MATVRKTYGDYPGFNAGVAMGAIAICLVVFAVFIKVPKSGKTK